MWVLYASLNPLADAFRNVFSKKASRKIDPLIVSWSNNLLPLLFFSPFIFFIDLKFNFDFWEAIFISGIINVAAVILYHRAISKSDISQVVPIVSFTPLFLLIMSPIIVGEFPDVYGVVGIVLIVLGSYLLNIDMKEKKILSPLRSLLKNKGSVYMLIVAFIWSISANYDKIGIQNSSVFQYIFFINLFVFTGTTIIASVKGKLKLHNLRLEYKNLAFVSMFTTMTYYFHMTALSLTLVAYVVTLKRTAGLITVFLGYFFFKESNLRERLLGASIMFAGVVFIILL
jgi:uncharacterized membrane protein